MLAPARNNVLTRLASPIGPFDTSITVVDASRFPSQGAAVINGQADPYVNEVVWYNDKSGNILLNCVRGYDDTTPEAHSSNAAIGLAVVAKHISDLQAKHGPTTSRTALAGLLDVDDTGRQFYDTEEDSLYVWVRNRWETGTVTVGTQQIRDYLGTAAEVLPLSYRAGDRWTDTGANFTVRVCKVATNTHAMPDWITLGRQN
jgi:hypothetical protein